MEAKSTGFIPVLNINIENTYKIKNNLVELNIYILLNNVAVGKNKKIKEQKCFFNSGSGLWWLSGAAVYPSLEVRRVSCPSFRCYSLLARPSRVTDAVLSDRPGSSWRAASTQKNEECVKWMNVLIQGTKTGHALLAPTIVTVWICSEIKSCFNTVYSNSEYRGRDRYLGELGNLKVLEL